MAPTRSPKGVGAGRFRACRRCEDFPSVVGTFNLRHAPSPRLQAAAVTRRHGDLELEGVSPSGPSGLSEIYRCSRCGRHWNLYTWYELGCFDLRAHAPCPRCGERLAVRDREIIWGEVKLSCDSCEARFSILTSGAPPGVPTELLGSS